MAEFLIDGDIIFNTSLRTLVSNKNGKQIFIHNNMSRCLECLVRHPNEIIPQNQLILNGWGEDAVSVVSNAAYYQCLVNLRKSFRALGCEKEIITTIRQRGVRISQGVNIEDYKSDMPCDTEKKHTSVQKILENKRRKETTRSRIFFFAYFFNGRRGGGWL